jgi:hypothetical protein
MPIGKTLFPFSTIIHFVGIQKIYVSNNSPSYYREKALFSLVNGGIFNDAIVIFF